MLFVKHVQLSLQNKYIKVRRFWPANTLLLIITSVVLLIYFVLDRPSATVHVVRIGLDSRIPRLPIFVISYLTYLPWLIGTLVYVWYKNNSFRKLAYSLILVDLVAYIVFLIFPTIVIRDPITSHDVFSNILRFVYTADLPYAGFPSLHCALSTVLATFYVLKKSKWSWAAVAMAVLIVISTLFTKQHFILDDITGVTLGIVATVFVFNYSSIQNKFFSKYKPKTSNI